MCLHPLCYLSLTISRMIRDQANKTIDLYLQRIRKFSSMMPDTALPSADPEESTKDAARIGTSNDNSWAGWAISSFTNKITTANGEIEPTANGKRTESDNARSASVPRSTTSTPAVEPNPAKKMLRPAAQLNRSVSEQPAPVAAKVEEHEKANDDVYEAWGAMDDDDEEEHPSKDEDPFSPVIQPKPSPSLATSPKPPAIPYDDGGEPDFAGWLAAQSKAKSKKPLPKGLSKPATSTTTSRTANTPATKPKTVVAPAKKIDTTPKDEEEDDGWGDAWD